MSRVEASGSLKKKGAKKVDNSSFNKITVKERIIILVIFFILIVIFGVFITREVYVSIKTKEMEAENLAIFISSEIERVCMHTFTLNGIYEALLFTEDEDLIDFPTLSKHLLPDYPSVSCVQLAPYGVVSEIYPFEGNEADFGINLFMHKEKSHEAFITRNDAILTVCGPYALAQGGEGFVGRLPVYFDAEKSEFWGFINVVVPIHDIFDHEDFAILEKHGYNFSIYKIDDETKEKIHIYGDSYESLRKPIAREIKIPNTNWEVALAPDGVWTDVRLCVVLVVMSFLLILAFTFMAVLIIQQYVSNRKLAQLAIIDQLTGLYSRQQAVHTLESEIENLSDNQSHIAVCFIDMNNFKWINDTHGHTVGDEALKWVAGRLSKVAIEDDIVARFGGDEFIIIFRGQHSEDYISLVDQIRMELNAPAQLRDDMVIDISAAVGVAFFPDNGKTVGELIQYADDAMYKEKARMKASAR